MPSALSSDQGGHTAAGVAACGSGAVAQEMTLAELIAAKGGLPEVLGAKPDDAEGDTADRGATSPT